MSGLFCLRCGSIMDTPIEEQTELDCSYCKYKVILSSKSIAVVETRSSERQQAEWAKIKDDNIDGDNDNFNQQQQQKHSTIEEPCPKCAHPIMYFYTMQLRSVDEGQTVFYECVKCKHKYSVNN